MTQPTLFQARTEPLYRAGEPDAYGTSRLFHGDTHIGEIVDFRPDLDEVAVFLDEDRDANGDPGTEPLWCQFDVASALEQLNNEGIVR